MNIICNVLISAFIHITDSSYKSRSIRDARHNQNARSTREGGNWATGENSFKWTKDRYW
jgi:hypothetical protein